MRKYIKILSTLFIVPALFFCLCLTSKANAAIEDPQYTLTNEKTGYRVFYYDGAGLIDEGKREEVLNSMFPVTEYGDVGFYTTDENTKTGGESFYNDVQYDWFGDNSSILVFIDMEDRYLWLQNYGELRKTVSDSMAESISDNAYKLAGKEKYDECAMKTFEQIYQVARGEKIARPMKVICNILLSLLLSFLILFVIIKSSVKIPRTDIDEWKKYMKYKVKFAKSKETLVKTRKVYNGGGGSSGGGHSGGHSGGGGGGHHGGGGGHHF